MPFEQALKLALRDADFAAQVRHGTRLLNARFQNCHGGANVRVNIFVHAASRITLSTFRRASWVMQQLIAYLGRKLLAVALSHKMQHEVHTSGAACARHDLVPKRVKLLADINSGVGFSKAGLPGPMYGDALFGQHARAGQCVYAKFNTHKPDPCPLVPSQPVV